MKRVQVTRKQALAFVGVGAVVAGVGIGGWRVIGPYSVFVTIGLAVTILLGVLYQLFARLVAIVNEAPASYQRQNEALFSLFATLRPQAMLPDMHGHGASPDVLKKLSDIVLRDKPSLIVEAGSGVSTIVLAYSLKQLGSGRLIALVDDAITADLAKQEVARHGLQDFATVIHAPLIEHPLDGERWPWYDTTALDGLGKIDLLFVKGPPTDTRPLARYPAVPALYSRLNEGATILLDDGNRRHERVIAAQWSKNYGVGKPVYLPVQKGAYIFCKNSRNSG